MHLRLVCLDNIQRNFVISPRHSASLVFFTIPTMTTLLGVKKIITKFVSSLKHKYYMFLRDISFIGPRGSIRYGN